MKQCRQCGKELSEFWSTDICMECSTENVKKIFKENPDVKEYFMKTIVDMKKELDSQTADIRVNNRSETNMFKTIEEAEKYCVEVNTKQTTPEF